MAKMAILRRAAKLVIGPATSGRTRWRPPQDDVSQESHMITERQKAFRQEYRSRIVGWYDGYFHVFIIYAMGAAAFYIYVQHIGNVTPLEWITVPLTFLFTNIFEWAVHKYVMHRPVNIKGLRAI